MKQNVLFAINLQKTKFMVNTDLKMTEKLRNFWKWQRTDSMMYFEDVFNNISYSADVNTDCMVQIYTATVYA